MEKENNYLVELIRRLRKEHRPLWHKVADMLAKPRRRKVEVNLSKIDKYAKNGSIILIPGKVLGAGMLTKKVTVSAFAFSESAKKMIEANGGKLMSINELLDAKTAPNDVLLLS